jgi:TonB family protein
MEPTSRLQRESTGEWIVVLRDQEIAAGGQSRVHAVEGRDDWLAKLYHHPAEQQARKLSVMLARAPSPGQAEGFRLAWPLDLLRGADRRLAGLLVPRIAEARRIFELYNPATRRTVAPLFHWGLLHRTALRLAEAFHALHEAGYVVGDVNESNILVLEDGDLAVIDTDSFQVRDPGSGDVYLCPVGRPEFTPPELQGRPFSHLVRSPLHDRFGLGVLLFQTLTEGNHPFAGSWSGPGEPPPLASRITAGAYPYDAEESAGSRPPRTAPPIRNLHPELQRLFQRCFVNGHIDPAARPAPAEWATALEAAAADLVQCGRNANHLHASHLRDCPWCGRARLLHGRDPFPDARAVELGAHLPATEPRPGHRSRTARPRQSATTPTPRAVAATRAQMPQQLRNSWIWAALLFTAGAFLPYPVGPFLPWPVAVVLLAVGWWRCLRSPGRPIAFTAVGTVIVLLMIPTAGAYWHARGFMPASEAVPPPAPPGASSVVYVPEALTRRPEPLDPAMLRAMVEDLPARADGHPGLAISFVVLRDGTVDPFTVTTSSADSAGASTLRSRLAAARFRPGILWGHPVSARVTLPIRWTGGRPVAVLDSATWNAGADTRLTTETLAISSDGPESAKLEARPELLNKQEVGLVLSRYYPRMLQDAGIGGQVVVQFVVDRDGTVDPGTIAVASSTHEQFAEASARVVSMFRFSPGRYQGKPVRVMVTMPITWQPQG